MQNQFKQKKKQLSISDLYMKTLVAIRLIIALGIIACYPAQAQQTSHVALNTMEAVDNSEDHGVETSSSTGFKAWVNGSLGLGRHGGTLNGSLNALIGSHFLSACMVTAEYDNTSHTDIGLLYGIGGGDGAMYSVGAGLAYVEDTHYTFGAGGAYDDNLVKTIGLIIQTHGSLNYYALGIDLGLHVCLASRSTGALMLGVNIGKLWND
jgi:hypothetical protein